jgi:polar amino acid transport system substrate-binding protein
MNKVRLLILLSLLTIGFAAGLNLDPSAVRAQGEQTPIPLVTLVPPTPLPPAPTATPIPPITRSAIARILERDPKTLVVGIPYNLKPFASISETGEVEGFEAGIASALAEDWGVNIRFEPVTRLNGIELLREGRIDLLLGQQVITRDTGGVLDFSEPIFIGKQVALKMADNPVQKIEELSGQTVGVVSGSPAEKVFEEWAAAMNLPTPPTINRYLILDDAIRDLGDRKITALVSDRWELDTRVRGKIEGVALLQGVFRTEPYGIAMLRFDENLRTLVNRTLQRFAASDRLSQIYDRWFPPGLLDPADRISPRVWRDLDADTRTINDFPVDVVRPAAPVLDKIHAGQPIRIAGLGGPTEGPNAPLERFNSALVYEMARRWGAQVEIVPNSFGVGEDTLASGNADLAVGLEPHWGPIDRLDYVGTYAERGYKFLARAGSGVKTFSGLRELSRAIATYSDDPNAFEIAKKIAVSINIPAPTLRNVRVSSDEEGIQAVFELQSARILFGDALRIIPLAEANKAKVELGDSLYEGRPLAFGVPRNDVDFRVLIEVTLQDMYRDGTYQRLWGEHWKIGDPLSIVVWPGPSNVFGIKTAG